MIKLLAWRSRSHPLRLATTTFAVALAVAFIAGTLVLTDTISETFGEVFESETAEGDVIVRRQAALETSLGAQRTRIPDDALRVVLGVEGVAEAAGSVQGYAQIVDADGTPVGSAAKGRPTLGMAWRDQPKLQAWTLVEGQPPEQSGEMVIDQRTARETGFGIGDVTTVLLTGSPQQFVIVGIAGFGAEETMAGATVALFDLATAQRIVGQVGEFDRILTRADASTTTPELLENLENILPPGVEAITAEELVAENETELADSLRVFRRILALFTAIALFIGSFLIHNTFTMTVAQRRSEFGLLRALGASRAQLAVAVLAESVAVGAIAAVAGVAAGLMVATGLEALLGLVGFTVPEGAPVLRVRTMLWCLVIGIGVTMASAALPARQAGSVAPIAAMRRDESTPSEHPRRRAAIGLAVLALGLLLSLAAAFGALDRSLLGVGIGGALVVIGATLLGPALTGPVARILGRSVTGYVLALAGVVGVLVSAGVLISSLIDSFWSGAALAVPALIASTLLVSVRGAGRGVPGLIGRENIARNPKRSATTASALMTGVAVVAAFLIMAASLKASIAAVLEDSLVGDLVVTSDGFNGGLSLRLADAIAELDEVDTASGVQFNFAEIRGESVPLPGVDTMVLATLVDLGLESGRIQDLGFDGIAISDRIAAAGVNLGDEVEVTFATTGANVFIVRAIYTKRDLAGDYLVDERAFDVAFADRAHNQVFVRIRPDADERSAREAVARVLVDHPSAKLLDADQFAAAQTVRVDQALGLVFGLLFLAILLALLGIGNTLALSILERTREFGMLRAIGMTRSQVRATVRWEAVVLAMFGTVVGMAIGVAFGWFVMRALRDEGFRIIELPLLQLALTGTLGAAVGVAAALIPERRASKLDVLDAIQHE